MGLADCHGKLHAHILFPVCSIQSQPHKSMGSTLVDGKDLEKQLHQACADSSPCHCSLDEQCSNDLQSICIVLGTAGNLRMI